MGRGGTGRRVVSAAAVLAVTSMAGLGGGVAGAAPRSAPQAVVVVAGPGQLGAVEADVVALGGRIGRQLPIISGFAASVRADALAGLRSEPGVVSVSPDQAVRPMSMVPALGYDPATDVGSLAQITQLTGAQAAWAAGDTGAGVDVALIDTGVTPVPGLAGKVLNGPDLSFDSPSGAMTSLDAYGHGTFMASLIAGRDANAHASAAGCATCLNASGYSDTTTFVGVAPDARILNVKVGAADGATDVSQVIAAIDWVVQHAHDPGVNIRVLNLSFGTQSAQGYGVDPLAYAAEQAWRHGIAVVAAAGNDGTSALRLADPAYDPTIIAVGADDPATATVPSFAQHGTLLREVDVVAPAVHVLGLRVPGSFIDTLATNTGQVGRFQRGSGTSEATAVVSGLVALLAQKYPAATPDQLKALIDATATPVTKVSGTGPLAELINDHYAGNGLINLKAALAATTPSTSSAAQTANPATGTGTLEASRGGVYVQDGGVNLTGETDIFGHTFNPTTMAALEATASSWSAGTWNGSRWSGDTWTGSRWSTLTWTGTDWAGSRWSGSRWSTMTWDGSRWSGAGWTGSRWTGTTWDGSRWSSYNWN